MESLLCQSFLDFLGNFSSQASQASPAVNFTGDFAPTVCCSFHLSGFAEMNKCRFEEMGLLFLKYFIFFTEFWTDCLLCLGSSDLFSHFRLLYKELALLSSQLKMHHVRHFSESKASVFSVECAPDLTKNKDAWWHTYHFTFHVLK